MVSSVKSRPNHYETLGLTPAASDEEITQAFASKMTLFRAHPMGEAAQIFAAYETLRNPIRRRDYDRSIGLVARPQPSQWAFAVAQPRWAPFIAPAAPNPVTQVAAGAPRTAEPFVTAEPESEEAIDARVASIAASLRELAKPAAVEASSTPEPEAPEARRAEPMPQVGLDQLLEQIRTAPRDSRERSFDWKQPAFAVAGLVLGAGILGALAGLSVTHNEEAAQAEPAVTMELPKPKPLASIAAPSPVAVADAAQAEPQFRAPPAKTKRMAPPQPASWTDVAASQVTDKNPGQSQPAELASDPLAPEPAAAQTAVARLPLPDKLVARTIERIGYSCGDVASTAAVDGAAQGVFRVTCSSGQTFEATPVHGRYRFRRSGSR